MLRADTRTAPVLATRRALNRSLLLHAGVVGVLLALPYLHRPPTVIEPPAIQAVLVRSSVAPQPRPVPPQPVEVPPPPAPEKIEVPEPVKEPPRIALPKVKPEEKPKEKPPEKPREKPPLKPAPKTPETKPAPPKSVLSQQALKMPLAPDDEVQSLRKEMKQEEMDRLRHEMDSTARAMKSSANAAQISRYSGLISQRVASKWNRPLSARKGMTVQLRINILPGGEVGNVTIKDSSGDAAFDASAVEAVKRSSPLPVPDDPAVFSQNFRNFTLKFTPEDL
ncbi:MAG TPA: cell envelope integrity protein TolA [Moraxellaceae bacterium]|nr:cell envelope integrity protein TolA [Moraxellaceae bacterium]